MWLPLMHRTPFPNLEVSYWTAVDTTLKTLAYEGATEYEKQMSALLAGHLPMEQGDLGTLERTYELTIEEASQKALKTVDPHSLYANRYFTSDS